MPWFHQTLKVADLVPENLKKNHVGKVIEEEGLVRWKRSLPVFSESTFINYFFQMFPPESFNSTREYHAVTRGYILNEIFRRVEPSGRTMGEFLRWLHFWLNRIMCNVYLSLIQRGAPWQDGGGHPLWGPRIRAGQGGGPAVVAGRGPLPEYVA